ARADRGCAGECLKPVLRFGEADRGVHLGLLVARLVVAERGCLLQCLADAGQIAVAENTEAASEKRLLDPIALHELRLEVSDDRLCGGKATRLSHVDGPPTVSRTARPERGSGGWRVSLEPAPLSQGQEQPTIQLRW